MEIEFLKWLVMGVFSLALYFMKRSVDQLDRTITENKLRIETQNTEMQRIRMEYLHKDDFKEFKAELWQRFDRLDKHLVKDNRAD